MAGGGSGEERAAQPAISGLARLGFFRMSDFLTLQGQDIALAPGDRA
ncbi:hypothetical protein SGRIM119S_03921 [Streptomyces griseorubiginosus]